METPVLQLINVSKKISDFFSLKNIYLDLFKGQVHILVGENGSGKSSLINIIAGSYAKDSGHIFVNGNIASIVSPTDSKNNGIAIIHQESCLFEQFTVAENIYMENKPYSNKLLKLIDKKKMYSNCEILFSKLGFNLNPKSLIRNLSIAEKQLVEICKAYVSHAKIIIMDEPTASLTESETLVVFKIINELKNLGAAILYISHKLEEIKAIGDKVSVMRNGEIVGSVNNDNLDVDNVIHMMTGVNFKERYPKLNVELGNDVLKVNNIYSQNILKGVSFSLRKKEILGIIGLVGSGRTQIAKCIFGLDKISQGEIYVNNKKVNVFSPSDALSLGIGYITEDRTTDGLFMSLNIAENLTSANISKVSDKHIIDKDIENTLADNYVDRLGIKIGTINDKPAYLSGGNQQKLVLGKWIMSKSKILIMDEPTKGIDIAAKVDLYNLMNEMIIKDVSIILISSDVDEVIGMCNRVLILYEGKVAKILPQKSATREKIMFYATGGK